MKNFVNEQITYFIRGAFAGCFAGGIFMFGTAPLSTSIILEYPLKLFGTIIIAFASGISTVLAADVYRHKIKPLVDKILKQKNKKP